jgi:4-aminobutyrate aminotransferase-like enzyme
MRDAEINEKHARYMFPCVANYYKTPLPIERGKGCYVYDYNGKEYLDFFGGILTTVVGHCPEKLTARLSEQLGTLWHASTLYPTGPMVDLAEKLARITPGRLQKSFFTCSGTEADETAVLLAKIHTSRHEIIALRNCYAGRSHLAIALTAQSGWRLVGAQIPGIVHAHTPYCYRCALKLSYPACDLACARDIEELIQTVTPGKVAAFIAEPIQGVGGFVTPPPEYFQVAVEIVRRYGGLFICDEVQTGYGRTGGTMWGIEHWGVEPDIMTMAKGSANGIPIGITIATPEVADSFTGMSISTFGGNPISSLACHGTIDMIEEGGLVEHTRIMGERLRERLLAMQERYPLIGDVRGMGLMQAIELVRPGKEPAKAEILQLFEATRERGLLIGKGGLYANVVRIAPPLNVTPEELDRGCDLLEASFETIR